MGWQQLKLNEARFLIICRKHLRTRTCTPLYDHGSFQGAGLRRAAVMGRVKTGLGALERVFPFRAVFSRLFFPCPIAPPACGRPRGCAPYPAGGAHGGLGGAAGGTS